MKLIILLICLALNSSCSQAHRFRDFTWFECYIKRVAAWLGGFKINSEYIVLAVLLLPIVLFMVISLWLLEPLLWGVWYILLSILIVWYSLGPKDLSIQLESYWDASGSVELAQERAAPIIDNGPSSLSAAPLLSRVVTQSIFWQAHERLLAIVFWFCLLGPVGAIAYRLLCIVDKQARNNSDYGNFATLAKHLHGLAAWLPARLSALTYVLVGDFVPGFVVLKDKIYKTAQSGTLLVKCGEAAMSLRQLPTDNADSVDSNALIDENREALALTQRALIIWIVIIALITIAFIID